MCTFCTLKKTVGKWNKFKNLKYFPVIIALACYLVAVSAITEEEERKFGKPDARCPSQDQPGEVIHLEHDTSCNMFYKCSFGRAYLMDCPQGMWWNQDKQYCDVGQGECKKGGLVRIPVANACPPRDDPFNPVHFPHPFECDKFYKCWNGSGILQACPLGLHFSTKTDRCERPEDAGCRA